MKRLLLKNNTPQSYFSPSLFNIPKSEFITDVQCPSCEKFPMEGKTRKWYYPYYHTFSKDAHLKEIRGYPSLFHG
jgi:hypothetical protein